MWFAIVKGFLTGGSLIIAIGAQNAFVLHQGLRQQHHIVVAVICAVIDVLLIFAGVAGLGILIQEIPVALDIARIGGALFLGAYGLKSFYSALTTRGLKNQSRGVQSLKSAVVITLSISLLNPHVYLDTVVLLGAIGGQLPGWDWLWFWVGASCASCCWFFLLSMGARQLAPWFEKPVAWQILDVIIGVIMFTIALQLVFGKF